MSYLDQIVDKVKSRIKEGRHLDLEMIDTLPVSIKEERFKSLSASVFVRVCTFFGHRTVQRADMTVQIDAKDAVMVVMKKAILFAMGYCGIEETQAVKLWQNEHLINRLVCMAECAFHRNVIGEPPACPQEPAQNQDGLFNWLASYDKDNGGIMAPLYDLTGEGDYS